MCTLWGSPPRQASGIPNCGDRHEVVWYCYAHRTLTTWSWSICSVRRCCSTALGNITMANMCMYLSLSTCVPVTRYTWHSCLSVGGVKKPLASGLDCRIDGFVAEHAHASYVCVCRCIRVQKWRETSSSPVITISAIITTLACVYGEQAKLVMVCINRKTEWG